MPEVECAVSFSLSIHCARCEWSMPLDELRAKGGKVTRTLSVLGLTKMTIETPAAACPRCAGQAFDLTFKI